jgi:hypothetical protein
MIWHRTKDREKTEATDEQGIVRRFLTPYPSLKPQTFNEKTRSVRVVAATEARIHRSDPFLGFPVDIVHLVDGVVLPPKGQVPLLDSHNAKTVSSVLGSARNFEVVGTALECEVFFSGTAAGKEAAQKVREGHLTDFSVGYIVLESSWIPPKKKKVINNREFTGPLKIHSRWRLLELSIAPIGADDNAKARSEEKTGAAPVVKASAPSSADQDTELRMEDVVLYAFIFLLLMVMIKGFAG